MTNIKSLRNDIKEKEKAKNKRKVITLAVILGVIIVAVVAINLIFRMSNRPADYANANGATVGLASAPVVVDGYSNFNCSHCRNFALNLEEDFVKKYVDTGKVLYSFKHFPFTNDNTGNAVEATYCAADQNKFWPMKTQLFKYNTYAGAFEETNLIRYAKEIGLDTAQFTQCLQSDKYLSKVAEDRQAAIDLGLDGTPYYFVNGQKVTGEGLESTIDAQLQALGQ